MSSLAGLIQESGEDHAWHFAWSFILALHPKVTEEELRTVIAFMRTTYGRDEEGGRHVRTIETLIGQLSGTPGRGE